LCGLIALLSITELGPQPACARWIAIFDPTLPHPEPIDNPFRMPFQDVYERTKQGADRRSRSAITS